MEFKELVSLLVSEHNQIKEELVKLRSVLASENFAEAGQILAGLKGVFREHIADEEAQVLRLLIDAYGVEGAEDAIVVFRQHRPIYRLMEAAERFSSMSEEEVEANRTKLKDLLDEHTKAEEDKVFPWAVSVYESKLTQREK